MPETLARITRDPEGMGGKPCLRGLRVTVGTIVGLVATGRSTSEILTLYPYLEEADIREATVVTLFLWPSLNLKLRPILLRQLRPGTRIVSYIHDMGDWAPTRQTVVDGRPIYLWTIPAAK